MCQAEGSGLFTHMNDARPGSRLGTWEFMVGDEVDKSKGQQEEAVMS